MANLHFATCSWKYPSWADIVYSAPKGINYLAEYARKFDSVEIDQWFWSLFSADRIQLPKAADVQAYREAVPDTFRFTIKAPNSITQPQIHGTGKTAAQNPHFLSLSLMDQFLELIRPLHQVTGAVFLQFEYLNKQKMASQNQFQELVTAFSAKLPRHLALGLETRNGNWLNEAFFTFLQKQNLRPVLLQGYWMPPVTQVYEKWRTLITSHPLVIIRLMGSDRQGIEQESGGEWNKIIWSKADELPALAEMIRDLLSAGVEVYVNVNNHYEGCAPLTIDQLRALI